MSMFKIFTKSGPWGWRVTFDKLQVALAFNRCHFNLYLLYLCLSSFCSFASSPSLPRLVALLHWASWRPESPTLWTRAGKRWTQSCTTWFKSRLVCWLQSNLPSNLRPGLRQVGKEWSILNSSNWLFYIFSSLLSFSPRYTSFYLVANYVPASVHECKCSWNVADWVGRVSSRRTPTQLTAVAITR